METREKKRKRERENELMISQCRTFSAQADSRFLALPSSIIMFEILTRTPIADILNCRCVCKYLRDLISDPSFVNVFISRIPFLSILHRSRDVNYRVVKLPGDNNNAASSHLVNTSFIPNLNSSTLEVIGCSNGLLCLRHKYGITSEFYITNPVLREYVLHPNPKNDKHAAFKEVYGFCSYPYAGKYKIIKIKTRRAYCFPKRQGYYKKSEAWILDVGTDGWRYAGDVPFPHWGSCLVFFNGCYHWMANLDGNGVGVMTLYSLDIKKEKAHQFPAPSELTLKGGQDLVGLGEYLCIFDASQSKSLHIWTMREYRVATSWTKDIILTTSIDYPYLRPFAVEENGMILIADCLGKIFCYDPREGTFTEVYDCHGGDVTLYTPTFLSLKHVVGGDFLTVRKVDN